MFNCGRGELDGGKSMLKSSSASENQSIPSVDSELKVNPRDLSKHRCTTVLYFGTDDQLAGVIEELTGENNIVIIEPDQNKRDQFLASCKHPNINRKDLVAWICEENDLNKFNFTEFCLARIHYIRENRSNKAETLLFITVAKYFVQLMQSRVLVDRPFIVMITYGRYQFTKMVLDRLKECTMEDFDLIIVDNGSSDETLQELAKKRKNYPQL